MNKKYFLITGNMVDKAQDTILAEYGNIDDWIPVMSDQ